MKSLLTALMICTLSVGAMAEKGLVNETRTDANGHKTIVIKDYRTKKPRPLKRSAPAFKEYDLGPSQTEYAQQQPVNVNYAPAPQPQQYSSSNGRTADRVQTYSQTYAPGPNKSMSPGGGGGSFNSTVLPTAPVWGWGFNGGYGPFYGNGYYGNGYSGNGYGRHCQRPYYPAQYPSTYPGFLPGLPSGPAVNLGYPVFNTVSPPIIPGAGFPGRGRCR